MVNDRISDILTRLRNGYLAGNNRVRIPLTKRSLKYVGVLRKEGLISEARIITPPEGREVSGKHPGRNFLVLSLRYEVSSKGTRKPVVRELKRESKPSLRRYIAAKNIPKLLEGSRKQYVLTTSWGTMSARLAQVFNIGGEVLFSFRLSPGRKRSGVPFYVMDAPRWLSREMDGVLEALQEIDDLYP